MHDKPLHEYCLQIMMNLNVYENWFFDISAYDFINALHSKLLTIFDGIYQKNGEFPSYITLHNQSFDHYITPYFWILNSIAAFKNSYLKFIKDLFLPIQGYNNIINLRIKKNQKMPLYIGILMTHAAFSESRKSLSELVFTLFEGKSDQIVLYFGIGRASGLLSSKGLLDQGFLSVNPETNGDKSLPEMTAEEEEEEYEKLICTIDKLNRNGLIQLKRESEGMFRSK